MQPTYQKRSKAKLVTTVVAIVVIAGIILVADHLKSKDAATSTNTATTGTSQSTQSSGTTSGPQDTSTSSSSTYKDGTYTASSSYYVPHGNEEIDVSLTLKDGVVTDSSITNSEGDHDSAAYQEEFTSAYKSYVVGKKITDIQLGVIAGASDTTQGFNDAVNQIASKAQA